MSGPPPDGYRYVKLADGVEGLEPDDGRPPECQRFGYQHDALACPDCLRRRAWAREVTEDDALPDVTSMRVSGDFLFDQPTDSPIFGTADEMLAAEGQAWMLVGGDGTGKTSSACQYSKARLGLADDMWGLPVAPLPEDQSVYYLAMDRPRQMMEAFMRGIDHDDSDLRAMLSRRLSVHRGPPPYRLGRQAGQEWLVNEVGETNAGLVVFDSRKDVGDTLDSADVLGVATAVQLLVADDVDVLILAHPTKGNKPNGPPLLEYVSGHREVFSGLGSVVYLNGRPGHPVIDVHQVKPIREPVRPFKITHDHRRGVSERMGEGIVPGEEPGDLVEGRMPVDVWEVRVLRVIDAHPDGEAPSSSLMQALGTDNLSRDLRTLIEAGVIESNGRRGPQAGYLRGPKAPPR